MPPASHSVTLKCALDTPSAPSPGSAFTMPRGCGSRRDLMFAPACPAPTLPRSPSHARLAEAPLHPPPSPLPGLCLAATRRFSLACGQQKALRTRRASLGDYGASFAAALQPPATEWGLGTSEDGLRSSRGMEDRLGGSGIGQGCTIRCIREDDFTPVRVSWQPEPLPQAASGSPELVRAHSV